MTTYALKYDQHPTTTVNFRLMGDTLRPEIITKELGVPPFKAWAKGDRRGARPPYRTGVWSLAPNCSVSETFEAQLARLLDQLEVLPPALHEFTKEFRAQISVGFSSGESNFGFYIDQPTLLRLCRLKVAMDFDIYVINEGADDEE